MFNKPPSTPAPEQQVLDQNGHPIDVKPGKNTAVMEVLALGAGALLLLSAGKSRSMLGGLIKGSAAAALLGRAAKGGGTLGKVASTLQGAKRR